MDIFVGFRPISGRFNLTRAFSNLSSETGGTLLLKTLREEVSRQLSPFGITTLGFLEESPQEILVCPDGKTMAVTRLVQASDKRFLQITILYQDDADKDKLLELFNQIPQGQGNTIKGSVIDKSRINQLEKHLAKLSPNGQKLSKPEFQKVLPKCLEKPVRQIIREVYDTYETATVPKSILMKSDTLSANDKLSLRVLSDSGLFDRKYLISCENCDRYIAPLIYNSSKLASSALDSSTTKQCPMCNKSLSIADGYSVKDVAWQSVVHGLWLEHLVYSVANERAIAAFTGRMAGLHELDVVAVLGGEIILFECRDTAFGHNDPFVIAGKAASIGASRVFGITTKAIHPNVKQAVEEQSKSGRRVFHLEQAEDVDEIRSKVTDFLTEIEQNYVRQLLPESRRTEYEHTFAHYYYDENAFFLRTDLDF